jgi:hypothetical protein
VAAPHLVLALMQDSPCAVVHPEVISRPEDVLRYVWEGRFGSNLIEVRQRQVYVNGKVVEPMPREALGLTAA